MEGKFPDTDCSKAGHALEHDSRDLWLLILGAVFSCLVRSLAYIQASRPIVSVNSSPTESYASAKSEKPARTKGLDCARESAIFTRTMLEGVARHARHVWGKHKQIYLEGDLRGLLSPGKMLPARSRRCCYACRDNPAPII